MSNKIAPKSPYSFSMLGWALNEEENIEAYIQKAKTFLSSITDDYELILIDDGSTDRTFTIAQKYQSTNPWIKLYKNSKIMGSGYNAKYAISLATKDYLFWQTVDWAYDINNFSEHILELEHITILQGVRQSTRILRTRSDNIWRAIMSLTNYYLIKFLFRLPLSDYQNVTIYPRELIQSINIESSSSFTNPECLLKTWWLGASFKEIQVNFIKRITGEAKGGRIRSVIKSISNIFYYWVKWLILNKREFVKKGKVIKLCCESRKA